MQINKTIKNEKTGDSDAFSKVEHRDDNPVASLEYARVNKSIIHVYVAKHEKRSPISMLPSRKTLKSSQRTLTMFVGVVTLRYQHHTVVWC